VARRPWTLGGEVKALKPENLTLVSRPEPPAARGEACSAAQCSAALRGNPDEPRRRADCACGAPSRCTRCGVAPYHYHGDCGKQELLRSRWLEWLRGGREAYQRLCRRAQREAAAQQCALREATQAIGHAGTMGGKAGVEPSDGADGAAIAALDPRRRLLAARANAISGHDVYHFFSQCAFCGSGGNCIVGPRFRCLHCPAFDCCLQCEPRLAAGEHDATHTFEIMFESEFDWGKAGVTLPAGTRARLRGAPHDFDGSDGGAPASAADARPRKRRHHGIEGVVRGFKKGKYELDLHGVGLRHVLPQDLLPIITQRDAEMLLGAGT